MALLVSTPNLADLVEPFLVRHYAPMDCWRLVIDLLQAGGFVEADVEPRTVLQMVTELWFTGDIRDPIALSQPWDWWLLRKTGPAVGHIGLVVDGERLVHVSTAGPAQEPLRRWRPRLVQIARLRSLL